MEKLFDFEKYKCMLSDLDKRLKAMPEQKRLEWLKKKKKKYTKKLVAKCLKSSS